MALEHLKKQPKSTLDGRIPPQGGSATAPSLAQAAAPAAPKPKVFLDTITLACGHQRPLAKLAAQPCQECRNREVAAARRARAERQRAKCEAKAVQVDQRQSGRLPDQAEIFMAYNAAAVQWSGSLTIPGFQPVSALASSQKKLLSALDAQYRTAVAAKETE